MCFSEKTWKFMPYPKHRAPLKARERPLSEIHQLTVRSRSLYYPEVDPKAVEETALRHGVYVSSPKPNTVYKVSEFPNEIGASNGEPSKWVKVESTNAVFHGRPITE